MACSASYTSSLAASSMDDTVHVAVIGTGLAGLVTAYSLETGSFTRQDGSMVNVKVQVFEKSDTLGMDSSSISVTSRCGTDFRIDSPMRSVNGGSHGLVMKLYKHLGINLRKSDFSYSFSRLARNGDTRQTTRHIRLPAPSPPPPPYRSDSDSDSAHDDVKVASTDSHYLPRPSQSTEFLYEGSSGLVWPPLAFPSHLRKASLFSKARYLLHLALLSLSYLHIVLLAFFYVSCGLNSHGRPRRRLQRVGRAVALAAGFKNVAEEPVDEWCDRHRVWPAMRDEVLVPLYAAVCTVGRHEAADMPVSGLLDYIVSTFLTSHYVTAVGVQQVVQQLTRPLPQQNIHLGSPITSMTYTTDSFGRTGIMLTTRDGPAPFGQFDHVVFATQANQAARLLSTVIAPSTMAKHRLRALDAFTYHRTLVVTHTDTSILPDDVDDRRDLNLVSFEDAETAIERKQDVMDCGTDKVVPKSWIQATHVISRTHPTLNRQQLKHRLGANGDGTAERQQRQENSTFLQTTNPIVEIDPRCVLSETWYERAVLSRRGNRTLHRFILSDDDEDDSSTSSDQGDLQGVENVWFVGSWCAEGIPLLEGCVSSSKGVVRHLMARHGVKDAHLAF
ncbi:hypothetical protein ACM66B_003691 [Microbotryomycetes sp. NB124-2]